MVAQRLGEEYCRLSAVGPQHPRVRQFLSIKHNRGPNHDRAVAIEGVWALRHAVNARAAVEAFFACPELLRGDEAAALAVGLGRNGVPGYRVSDRTLRRMVDREGPDGVAAIARLPKWSLADVPIRDTSRLVVLDGLELAGNVGTIIRCADGAGADAVILTSRRVRVTHPRLLHASMGTVFYVPLVEASTRDAIRWFRSRSVRIVGADPERGCRYADVDLTGSLALVIGSERYGLSAEWREALDERVAVPMLGVADSLNAGHAAAVLLYEALRQQGRRVGRDQAGPEPAPSSDRTRRGRRETTSP